jgi:hypothetical protein
VPRDLDLGTQNFVTLTFQDIPTPGFDGWVGVYPLSGSRTKHIGSVHLQVTLSYKQVSVKAAQYFQYISMFFSVLHKLLNCKNVMLNIGIIQT